MAFWVYMLLCGDGSIYTGQTDELEVRFAQHRFGEMGGYTHDRRRFKLIWAQELPSRDDALIRERQIKGWTRRKKLALAEGDWEKLSQFARGPDRAHGHSDPSTPLRYAQGER